MVTSLVAVSTWKWKHVSSLLGTGTLLEAGILQVLFSIQPGQDKLLSLLKICILVLSNHTSIKFKRA